MSLESSALHAPQALHLFSLPSKLSTDCQDNSMYPQYWYIKAGFVFFKEWLTLIMCVTFEEFLRIPSIEACFVFVLEFGALWSNALHPRKGPSQQGPRGTCLIGKDDFAEASCSSADWRQEIDWQEMVIASRWKWDWKLETRRTGFPIGIRRCWDQRPNSSI